MSKYDWQPGMAEISGFGGDYEKACRDMVRAGMEWFDAHPDADPRFRGYEGVYGILLDDNEDAKALSKAVCEAPLVIADGGPTGAMHQAAVSACLFIRARGWAAFVVHMTEANSD
jgi:hypothetical protein